MEPFVPGIEVALGDADGWRLMRRARLSRITERPRGKHEVLHASRTIGVRHLWLVVDGIPERRRAGCLRELVRPCLGPHSISVFL
jgi:hypothetical protein